MNFKYHLIGVIGGGAVGAGISYLLMGNAGLLFGVLYGVVIGEIIAVSIGIRNKNK